MKIWIKKGKNETHEKKIRSGQPVIFGFSILHLCFTAVSRKNYS